MFSADALYLRILREHPDAKNKPTQLCETKCLPGEFDVICGRGVDCFNHIGNQRFRQIVNDHLDMYSRTKNKYEKSLIISIIVNHVRGQSQHGGFIRKDHQSKQYYEVGDFVAREKTSQAIRDALVTKSKLSHKASKISIYTKNMNHSMFNNQVRDFYPKQSTTTASHVTIENLSISSKVCLEETMDDIVSILKSSDNITKNQVYDNQTEHITQNENWNLIPLDDNDIFNDFDDFMSELKLQKTKSSSLTDINYEENSSSLSAFIELSQSDIEYILNECDGI